MRLKLLHYLYLLAFLISFSASAQVACPDNIDFEQGVFNKWECAIGVNNGTANHNWSSVTATSNRHTIMSGIGTDPHGNFPVVAPGGGMYSVKLGNDGTAAQMDRIRYTLNVPPNASNFNLIYRYAVVFQDGGHNPNEQPFFQVAVTDSVTGQPISCNFSTYISTSNIPGFIETSPGSNVWYKDWTAATLRIAGMGGHTLFVEFVTADCSLGGHYGYGYVDLNCNGYAVTSANCNGSISTPLVGPPGFQQYTWYDSSYSTSVGTGQTIYIPSPATSNFYNLVLTPYPGYGCVDTLSTRIAYSNLAVTATPDTSFLCGLNASAHLNVTQVGDAPPYTYSWTPVATLSCVTCKSPTATPTANTAYVVAVTDSIGCTITDTAYVNTGVTITVSKTNVTCYQQQNGSVAVVAVGGRSPYTYKWNNNPALNTATLSNLAPGVYSVQVTDANSCTATGSVTVTQPTALLVTSASTNVSCAGGNNGTATVNASGGTQSYTYSWNTTPVQTSSAITGLPAGTYICTVTDANGCTATATRVITQPLPISVNTNIVVMPCAGLSGGVLAVHAVGGTAPFQYYWDSGIFLYEDTVRNLRAGTYLVQATDARGCFVMDTITLTEHPLPIVNAGTDASICIGDSALLTANGATSYSWQPPSFLTCTTCLQPLAYPDVTTSYTLTGTDGFGCVNKDTVMVTVIQHVPVSVDSTRHICPDEKIALGAYGGASYEWTPPATLTGALSANPVAAPDSTLTYQVIITENSCFKDTLQQQVIVMPKPSILLGADFFGIPGATVTLETQVSGAESIAWYPPAGLSCYDCYAPVASLDTNIAYLAEVTNSYGCKARDTIRIRVACDGSAIYVANTFTPNNDGQNDFFYPQGLGINSVKRFMIYDRWGETVFSAVDIPANVPERGWNGMFRNKELPPDVFLYVIETICKDGSPIVLKGDITLVR